MSILLRWIEIILRTAIFRNILSYYFQKHGSQGVLQKCYFTGKHLRHSPIEVTGVSPLIYNDRTPPRNFSCEITPYHTRTTAFELFLIKVLLFKKSRFSEHLLCVLSLWCFLCVSTFTFLMVHCARNLKIWSKIK